MDWEMIQILACFSFIIVMYSSHLKTLIFPKIWMINRLIYVPYIQEQNQGFWINQ